MEHITYTKTYQEYKQELDTELSKTAEGFVRIGYLLKVARDTEILAESGYSTVTEFAKAEYGIDKTMVSRFISINDKFAEGGYSDQLQEQYKGYGYAKLTLMLTLPDEINAQLSPAYSKAEIQAIKDEIDEEKSISDLEVMMETPTAPPAPDTSGGDSLINRLIRQLGEDSPQLYLQMAPLTRLEGGEQIRAIKETMAPNGEKQYSIRIPGTGRYMLSIRDTEDTVTATSLRTMEQHTYDYPSLLTAWAAILPSTNGKPDTDWTEEQTKTSWELEYDRPYPQKTEVAPVQLQPPTDKASKPAPHKESKVQKAPKPRPAVPAPAAPPIPPTPEPEKPENTGTETISGERTTDRHEPEEKMNAIEPEKPESTGTERITPEEQLPGQIGIEEAIKETDERSVSYPERETSQTDNLVAGLEATEKGIRLYRDTDNPPEAAGQEPDSKLDEEWNKQKKILFEHLKQMSDERFSISRDFSTLAALTLKLFHKELIDIAALIEKELLRRGEEF